MQTDIRKFIQRHWELWSRLYPGVTVSALSPEQKAKIHQQISREFSLSVEETDRIRMSLLNSADSAPLILPFVDHKLEILMRAANAIAAGG